MTVPVIDLFAGPGGLGEGFASCFHNSKESRFEIRLSIEKDPTAHRTLQLRSFFRSFQGNPPVEYYDYLRGRISRDELFSINKFSRNLRRAEEETW
jgi:DNA (cytosine-5)-methyltransferase 1